ncbi:MAG: IPT/TIG domain-containing protein, partial [Bacteroidota bacterium]
IVYGPQNYTPMLTGWNTHTFSTPFSWNGTSNLLVDICFSNQVVGAAAYLNYYSTTSFVSTDYYHADGTSGAGACNQTTGTATGSRRPNMIFRTGNNSATVTSNNITISTQAAPSISTVTPSAGPASSRVNITGNAFVNVSQVNFNNFPATNFSVVSPTAISAIVPANGGGNVSVSTACGTSTISNGFTLSNTMNLTIQVLFEGFYRGSGLMINTLGGSNTDTAEVALAASSAPFNVLYSSRATVNTSGTGVFNFTGVPQGYSYYLIIRHRNSMETWSSVPINFSNLALSYDFSNNDANSFGNNVKNLGGGKFGLYSGDVNQDNIIDLTDLNSISSATANGPSGYLSQDIT